MSGGRQLGVGGACWRGRGVNCSAPTPALHVPPRTLVRTRGTDVRSMCPHMRHTQGGGGCTRDGVTGGQNEGAGARGMAHRRPCVWVGHVCGGGADGDGEVAVEGAQRSVQRQVPAVALREFPVPCDLINCKR